MKKFLGDYGLSQEIMVVYCDNSSVIDIPAQSLSANIAPSKFILILFASGAVQCVVVCP